LKYKREHDTRPRVGNYRSWIPIIQKVNEQLDNVFTPKGIKPTLRTMYYRLLALKIIKNTDYGNLSRKTTQAREGRKTNVAGSKGKVKAEYLPRLPIDCFADDSRHATRYQSELNIWEPVDIIGDRIGDLMGLANDYQQYIPTWVNQKNYVAIWTEKNAMVETFKSITSNIPVDIVPLSGYGSVTFLYDNAQILKEHQELGKKIHILYFGDFDPTGQDIPRVVQEKLNYYGVHDIDFRYIGVTKQQVDKFHLPIKLSDTEIGKLEGNEKKKGDSRVNGFKKKHGELYQVELDALPAIVPEEFRNMVLDPINELYDQEIYDKVLERYSPESVHELVKEEIKREFGFK
jgi:hypothetical protein